MKVRHDDFLGTTLLFQTGEENTAIKMLHILIEMAYNAGDVEAYEQISAIAAKLEDMMSRIGHA